MRAKKTGTRIRTWIVEVTIPPTNGEATSDSTFSKPGLKYSVELSEEMDERSDLA